MDQDATWYTEVGLGLRDIVFDVDPATPEKGIPPHPIFGPCLWPNGRMDEDAAWREVGEGSPRRDAAQDGTAAYLAQSGPTYLFFLSGQCDFFPVVP